MTLQIEFKTEGADQGQFLVRGMPAVGPEFLVAVQRLADDRYLTMHGRWDDRPSWYPCPCHDGNAGEVRLDAGAALTAGIRAAGSRLRVHIRRHNLSDTGLLEFGDSPPLSTRQPSTPDPTTDAPSPAGHGSGAPPVPESTQAPSISSLTPPSDNDWAPGPTAGLGTDRQRQGLPTASITPETKPSAIIPIQPTTDREHPDNWLPGRLYLVILMLSCGAAMLWWYLSTGTNGPPTPSTTPASLTTDPTGKALYLRLRDQHLSPTALFEQGERASLAGDCEAAIRLFVEAARRDADLAVRLGGRYDPAGFRPTPCFTEPKPDSVQGWFQQAAEAGNAEAQRRYGEMLLAEANAGPVHEDAIAWLRKAAAAGDATAADRLMALGEH